LIAPFLLLGINAKEFNRSENQIKKAPEECKNPPRPSHWKF
jgi:hypothetical protein